MSKNRCDRYSKDRQLVIRLEFNLIPRSDMSFPIFSSRLTPHDSLPMVDMNETLRRPPRFKYDGRHRWDTETDG